MDTVGTTMNVNLFNARVITQPTPSRAIDLGRQITSLVFIISASRISGSSKLHAAPRTTSWSIPAHTNDTDHIGIQGSLHSDD
ncbi:hypothetical protein BG003_003888 [Podila horticola]|nr:hypothetical protein BG003_003888 [Podila horticola]